MLKTYDCKYLTYDMKKEICRLLDNNFKSYFQLLRKNKKLNPKPPKYRGKNYFFTLSFTQDFILKENILILSNKNCKQIKIDIGDHIFKDDSIKTRNKSRSILKQCKLYKEDNDYYISIVYEYKEKEEKLNGNFLSIDLGKKNLITYYDEKTNSGAWFNSESFYKNQKYFDKRIDELKGLRDKKKERINKMEKT